MYILESETPQFYSRYLSYGFKDKYDQIEARRPEWTLKIWFEQWSFTPFSPDGVTSRRALLHYYTACMIVFIMSYLVEYMNQRRYNWQAKALRDHNPLIHRKGLQSLTKQQQEVDGSLEV